MWLSGCVPPHTCFPAIKQRQKWYLFGRVVWRRKKQVIDCTAWVSPLKP